MVSTFFGFAIAMRGIMAAQKGLEITAHNIANANTPGYSRQRPEFVVGPGIMYPGMNRPGGVPLNLGGGVDVRSVNRIRDVYLDHIIRNSTSDSGLFLAKEAGFSKLEVIMNEPSQTGLSSVINELFNSFADLSNNPELTSERANVMEKGLNLAQTFNQFDSDLKSLRSDQNRSISLSVNEVNNILDQIGNLNQQIIATEGIGDQPNDLKDTRDLLLDRLSELINIDTIDKENGNIAILINGVNVLDKDNIIHLETRTKPGTTNGDIEIFYDVGLKAKITSGEINGYFKMRDEIIPDYQDRLNRLASSLVNRINYQHRKGYGLDEVSDRPFFSDYITATMSSTMTFPPGTTLDTPIDELGITAGNFFIQNTKIEITKEDVTPAEAITLGEVLERINTEQPWVRASLTDDFTGTRIQLDLYNPPDISDTIHIYEGSSNFLTSVTGMMHATVTTPDTARVYTNAMDMISVSLALQDNLDIIAAAYSDESNSFAGAGDNTNALNLAELNDGMNSIDNSSFSDYYNSVIGSLGSQAQTNDSQVINQGMLLGQLENQKLQVSGVSIDEEALNMIQYQRAFEGAAKVSSTLDSMIETIIFGLSA